MLKDAFIAFDVDARQFLLLECRKIIYILVVREHPFMIKASVAVSNFHFPLWTQSLI
jgi:hypothetical protein